MICFPFVLGIGYFVGALPTGAWLARSMGIRDISQHGSGNIGATNVGRIFGWQYFFFVLLVDALKALLFMNYVVFHYPEVNKITLAAIALLLGNGFSCFLKGKGGKGVATSLGIMAALHGFILQYVFIGWLTVLFLTRNVGVSSVMGLCLLPIVTYYLAPGYIILALFISLWGLWRHASNIRSFLCSMGFKNF